MHKALCMRDTKELCGAAVCALSHGLSYCARRAHNPSCGVAQALVVTRRWPVAGAYQRLLVTHHERRPEQYTLDITYFKRKKP